MSSFMSRLALVAASLLLCRVAASPAVSPRATTCNGYSELCDKSYGTVSFVGAHDSYAVGIATQNLATNQDYDVTQQLTDGVRLLQLQAHNQTGTIQLCHSSCSLYNGGTLADYLGKVKTWMDSNTNEVVTILIVNIDNLAASEFASVFTSAGLDSMSFSPSSASLAYTDWPTLGSMIDDGKRLVTFLDNQADFTSVSWLLDEFTNVWETAYDVTDTTFDCNVNRTQGDTSTQMYLINHFLDRVVLGAFVPNIDQANQTNSASGTGSLGLQVQECSSTYGRAPNFLLVDFYEYGGGSVFQVAASANNVTYSATSIATPRPTTSSSTSAASSGNAGSSLTTLVPTRQQWLGIVSVSCGVVFGALTVL